MNRFAAVSLLVAASSLVACTNDDKPSKSAGAALDSIQNPTGTFDASNASGAFGSYSSNKNASNGLGSATGGSGSSSTQAKGSLRFLADQAGQCREGQSCACAGGGSFVAERETTDYGPAIKAQFDSCVFDDGRGFDGNMVLLASDKPLLKNDKLGDVDGGKSVLIAAEGTFSNGTDRIKADVVLLSERGADYLAVEVADGKIVIGVRESDGAAVVYAKDTLWLCTQKSGEYTCQEQSSGEKVQASKSGDSASAKTASNDTEANSEK